MKEFLFLHLANIPQSLIYIADIDNKDELYMTTLLWLSLSLCLPHIHLTSSTRPFLFNPLTTNYDYSHHRNSAACYHLAQSVLKIGSALAERVGGEVGESTALADSAWQLLQLAGYREGLISLDGPFFCFLV